MISNYESILALSLAIHEWKIKCSLNPLGTLKKVKQGPRLDKAEHVVVESRSGQTNGLD